MVPQDQPQGILFSTASYNPVPLDLYKAPIGEAGFIFPIFGFNKVLVLESFTHSPNDAYPPTEFWVTHPCSQFHVKLLYTQQASVGWSFVQSFIVNVGDMNNPAFVTNAFGLSPIAVIAVFT